MQHITTAPYHPTSNGLVESFACSFKEQEAGQNNVTALRKVLRSYRWTSHTTTDIPPAEMLLRLMNELIKQPEIQTKYSVGDMVWATNFQLNKRPRWQSATVKHNIGSMIYEVQLNNGWKRHQNQLRLRHDQRNLTLDIDVLLHDELDNESIIREISSKESPRYPRRNRKAPDRYLPMRLS